MSNLATNKPNIFLASKSRLKTDALLGLSETIGEHFNVECTSCDSLNLPVQPVTVAGNVGRNAGDLACMRRMMYVMEQKKHGNQADWFVAVESEIDYGEPENNPVEDTRAIVCHRGIFGFASSDTVVIRRESYGEYAEEQFLTYYSNKTPVVSRKGNLEDEETKRKKDEAKESGNNKKPNGCDGEEHDTDSDASDDSAGRFDIHAVSGFRLSTYGEFVAKKTGNKDPDAAKAWIGKETRIHQIRLAIAMAIMNWSESFRRSNEFHGRMRVLKNVKPRCPVFYDFSPLVNEYSNFAEILTFAEEQLRLIPASKIVAIGSRGYIFGGALAYRLGMGMVRADKKDKVLGNVYETSYSAEYDIAPQTMVLSTDTTVGVREGESVILFDDVGATLETMLAAERLVIQAGGHVAARVVMTDVEFFREDCKRKIPAPYIVLFLPDRSGIGDELETENASCKLMTDVLNMNKCLQDKSAQEMYNDYTKATAKKMSEDAKRWIVGTSLVLKEEKSSSSSMITSLTSLIPSRSSSPPLPSSSLLLAVNVNGPIPISISASDYDNAKKPMGYTKDCKQCFPPGRETSCVTCTNGPMKLISGSSHPELAEMVSKHLGCPLMDATVTKFKNGETRAEINENCRGCDVFVLQSVAESSSDVSHDGKISVNDSLMELFILISALRGASVNRITAVLPIYPYARQDKKDKSRACITARLVADFLTTAGVDRVITIDLHSSQIQGMISKPMDNLYAEGILMERIITVKQRIEDKGGEVVIVSADTGGIKRVERIAKKLG